MNLVLGSVGQAGTGGVDMWALNLLIHPVSSWSRLHAVLLFLLTAPVVSLLTLSVLFDGPVVDKV